MISHPSLVGRIKGFPHRFQKPLSKCLIRVWIFQLPHQIGVSTGENLATTGCNVMRPGAAIFDELRTGHSRCILVE